MILPTKRLPQDRALLVVGAQVLGLLVEGKTVSKLWDELKIERDPALGFTRLPYDWFVLALSFLYASGVVDFRRGRIRRTR
jgi:hypothetical protein